MKSRILLLATLFTATLQTSALAQEGRRQNKADAAADEKKVRSFDFSGDQIDGDQIRPEGSIVDTRSFATRTSLIRIRTDFIREILKSAEDL